MAKILVIDDNEDIRLVVSAVLQAAGHEVVDSSSGEAGAKLHRQLPMDLVITDIFMPGKDGLETIHDLKREFPSVAIIAMSGAGPTGRTATHLTAAEQLGADAILRKPFDAAKLLATVTDVLKRQAIP